VRHDYTYMRHVAFDESDDKGLDVGSCTLLVFR
jgi:hypothetical protein